MIYHRSPSNSTTSLLEENLNYQEKNDGLEDDYEYMEEAQPEYTVNIQGKSDY